MIGQKISHYQILEKLGEGGMGIVYKAQDIKLNRSVALKFLPQHLSASDQDKARFIQEAQAAAALSHPNICTIHGIEENDGQTYIVMEFVEGQTLRDKGPSIPLKQSVEIGIQLADGLAAAHEKGIVHRDIKPENIMIQKDGRVRIMDFGLAKLKSASRLTKTGSTVGTTGYMSPEQVQGMESDHRSDVFSLGVILYEMFAGQSPFKGVHETAINYEIVNVDPEPLSKVKPDIAGDLDSTVLECLAKEPSERYQSAAEVAKELRRYKRGSSRTIMNRIGNPPDTQSTGQGRSSTGAVLFGGSRWWILTSIVLFIAVVGFSFLLFQKQSPERQTVRFLVPPPEKGGFDFESYNNLAISPDQRLIAYTARDSLGKLGLWIRPVNSATAQPIPGTENGIMPFWSPDSRSIGFFAGGKLKRIEVSGGPAQVLCDANGRGGTWNEEGTILFGLSGYFPIYRVSASGGVSTQASVRDTTRYERSHRFPCFLPDGKHFLYTVQGGVLEEAGVYVGSLDGKQGKLLVRTGGAASYSAGHILYLRDRTLMAQPFSTADLNFTGEAFPLAEGIAVSLVGTSASMFSSTVSGGLVYIQGMAPGVLPAWFDRRGKQLGTLAEPASYNEVRISPDEKQVAAIIRDPKAGNLNIWIYETARPVGARFTFDEKDNYAPVWSPDGASIAFTSLRTGSPDLYLRPSNGVSSGEPLVQSNEAEYTNDWSHDGKYILYDGRANSKMGRNLWVVPRSGDGKPLRLFQTGSDEKGGRFSYDGRWVAFVSNESGRDEVYVRAFPGPGPKWQVSVEGGSRPRWRRDGKELIYRQTDGKIMSAEVRSNGSKFEVGKVQALFFARFGSAGGDSYDVTSDAQRFLIITAPELPASTPLTVVLNWDAEVKKK
jgi:serine/threonine protein kinase